MIEPEGQLALELGGASRQREPSALLGPAEELGEQRRLADPRLARHEHGLG